MGMSTHIKGFRPADHQYRQMQLIYEQCDSAGVAIPEEVLEFFDHERPEEHGKEIDISEAYNDYNDGQYRWGFEVDVTKLPKDCKIIRFYNAS